MKPAETADRAALLRLMAIAEQHDLPVGAAEKLFAILLELRAERASVTTVREPTEAVDAHVADSLSALAFPELQSARQIADLGAGNGFPGIALAVALPAARVVLVESVRRKCEFMARAAERAGLTNVEVVNARAELWQEGLARNDVVVARALAPLNVLAEYAAPLLVDGGVLIAYKGRRDPDEEQCAERAAAELGMNPTSVTSVSPYPSAGQRHLYSYEKTGPTPPGFPRRAGMARKRPLGTAR